MGGRRWAKFAKYLADLGYELFVVSAKYEGETVSEWHSDVKKQNIKTFEIPLGISKVLNGTPKTLSQKVIYKLLWKSLPFLVKGNPQDKLVFVKDKFIKKASELITKNDIKTVIVSIPPYKLGYYMLELKKLFPHIKFITDYRDPWTDNKSYHGFDGLSEKRFKIEEQYEKEVLEKSDLILDVHLENLEALKLKAPKQKKFFHLLNGFDKDDYSNIKPMLKVEGKIRFIYSGSFYPNLIYLFEPFLNCLIRLKSENPELYNKLQFDFFGGMDHKAVKLLADKGVDIVKYHGSVSKAEVLSEINRSDFSLMFSAPDYSFAFNTKFYDYLFLRKPIMYFGHIGKVSEYVAEHKIGEVFSHDKIETDWYSFISTFNKVKNYNTNVDVSEFELGFLTQKLIKLINE
ncbi:MAG: hypothetical protein IPJ32_09365 [Sphingobacteriaceae bacterium]|nr:hypothetical protein [Sphingobacteriaceae bacterium]